jgi:hypothetical protein
MFSNFRFVGGSNGHGPYRARKEEDIGDSIIAGGGILLEANWNSVWLEARSGVEGTIDIVV